MKKIAVFILIFFNIFILFKSKKIFSEEILWKVNETFFMNLEISDNYKTRELGLMNRKKLEKDKGMIFIYDRIEPVNIWMHKTFIPLDILFIKNNLIQKIQVNAKPCPQLPCELIPSIKPVDMVIEINGGLSKELNLQEGDYLNLLKNENIK